MVAITFVVVHAFDVKRTKAFYECLGFVFRPESHDNGPLHETGLDENGFVFEIYPDGAPRKLDRRASLGFEVNSLKETHDRLVDAGLQSKDHSRFGEGKDYVLHDPDGRKIVLSQKQY